MNSLAAAGLACEWELAMLSTGTEARRRAMRKRLELLIAEVDWSKLTALLAGGRLLPSLGPRILEIGGERAGEEFKAALAASLEAGRHQDALLQLVGGRILEALAEDGIRATPLKGPTLGEAIYGQPGRRQSSDIDILVAAENLHDAVAVARGLGYAAPADAVGAGGLPQLHFSMAHARGELPPLELHWRIHWYESSFAPERLLTPEARLEDWRPSPADELAALLLYYARDGFTGLRQAADLGAWWDQFGSQVSSNDLAETARAFPELEPTLTAAAIVGERTVGAPLALQGRRLGTRGGIAVRLGTNPQTYSSREQLFAEIGLIDGLLTPTGGLWQFIRRQVAPSPEVIREHAERAGGTQVDSTTGYAARVLARYALALVCLLRSSAARRRKPRSSYLVRG